MGKEADKLDDEFVALRVRVCEKTELSARRGASKVMLDISDVRQMLHVLAIRPFRTKTMEESTAEMNNRRRASP